VRSNAACESFLEEMKFEFFSNTRKNAHQVSNNYISNLNPYTLAGFEPLIFFSGGGRQTTTYTTSAWSIV
jgi:hypothetical protein